MQMFIVMHGEDAEFIAPSAETANAICDYNNQVAAHDATWWVKPLTYLPHNPVSGMTRPYGVTDGNAFLTTVDSETFGLSDKTLPDGLFITWRATPTGALKSYENFLTKKAS